jgi:hypothetical protein
MSFESAHAWQQTGFHSRSLVPRGLTGIPFSSRNRDTVQRGNFKLASSALMGLQ